MAFCNMMARPKLVCGVWLLAIACGTVCFSGCGNATPTPKYEVTGTVTYLGEPVPSGLVKFEPDTESGGVGPGAYAPIKNGTFQTEQDLCAGPMKVTVCGMDGVLKEVVKYGETVKEETRIFDDYVTEVVIEEHDMVIDFEVPQS